MDSSLALSALLNDLYWLYKQSPKACGSQVDLPRPINVSAPKIGIWPLGDSSMLGRQKSTIPWWITKWMKTFWELVSASKACLTVRFKSVCTGDSLCRIWTAETQNLAITECIFLPLMSSKPHSGVPGQCPKTTNSNHKETSS